MQPIKRRKKAMTLAASGIIALSSFFATPVSSILAAENHSNHESSVKGSMKTTTPIKHVVVIFGENVSFDHYFGTYPNAKNLPGEPTFVAKPNTPAVNGLQPNALNGNRDLLTQNPNTAQPNRLGPDQAHTSGVDHGYYAEQNAFNGGKMDNFVDGTGHGKAAVMNYYDGNTVTGLWNYAQNFAMSDNSFNTTFGPSTPGALNLISGQIHGATAYENDKVVPNIPNEVENGSVIGDPDPKYDYASNHKGATAELSGKNIGDVLTQKNITWGWFQGGFRDPQASHKNIAGQDITDYSPHHQPFEYYKSTSNPDHKAPSSVDKIGSTDQANHQYDLADFWSTVDAGHMPAVSFLKAARYQDGHPGNSDPLDEQQFIVETINKLQQQPTWKDTAVILAYDDSDGWYDHVAAPVIKGSDQLTRAGYGPRLPLLVVSPYAKKNFVDHTLTDQTSILRFIEDNWKLGRIEKNSYDNIAGSLNNMFDFSHAGEQQNKKLFLDPKTGQSIAQPDNGKKVSDKNDDQDKESQDNNNQNNNS
jgi:phospholipase C